MTHADQVAADAQAARRTIEGIARDVELDFPHRPPGYLTRTARRLREALAALDAEGGMLAAGVCEHRLGNEHGNAYCGKTGDLI